MPPRSLTKAFVAAGAAGAVILAIAAARRPPHVEVDARSVAAIVGARVEERTAAIAARATALAELPHVAAAVATDEVTVRNMTPEELGIEPQPGELITVAQHFRDGRTVVLRRLPKDAAAAAPKQATTPSYPPGVAIHAAAEQLVVAQTARIALEDRADELDGLLTVSRVLDPRALDAGLFPDGAGARLDVAGTAIALGHPAGPGAVESAPVAVRMAGASGPTATLIAFVPPAPNHAPLLAAGAGALALAAAIAALLLRRAAASGTAAGFTGSGAGTEIAARFTGGGAGTDPAVAGAIPAGTSTGTPMPGGRVATAQGMPPARPLGAGNAQDLGFGATMQMPAGLAPEAAAGESKDGERKIGRYAILRQLGMGGMAEVFVARSEGEAGFGKQVALKVLQPGLAAQRAVVELFLDEARLAARLDHPNIVQTLDLGRASGQYFIALEYVDGADLEKLLRIVQATGARVPVAIALGIACRVCDGLQAAHTATGPDGKPLNLVHRDVKSANVFVSRAGSVKVGDFGIAKATHAVRLSRTEIGQVKGTPGYMAPEHRMGLTVDRRADLYGVGAIAYELLAGAPVNLDLVALAARGTVGWPHLPPLVSLRDDLPTEIDAILVKALAYEPTNRFADCAELEAALRAASATLPGGLADDKAIGAWARDLLDRAAAASGMAVA